MALDRETVVRTGLAVLNDVGLEALTLRKIASELNVQPPALYWHFKSKQDLIDEMATTLMRDGMMDIPPDMGWLDLSSMYGHGLRAMLLRYRDGAKMFSGTLLRDPGVYKQQEAAFRVYTTNGFSVSDAATALNTVYCYTVGFVIEEQAVYPRPGERSPDYDIDKRSERMADQDVPLSTEAGKTLFDDYDARYARGLDAILIGVASWLRAAE